MMRSDCVSSLERGDTIMNSITLSLPVDAPVFIFSESTMLQADWSVPARPRGVILVTSAGNGSRFSRKTRQVARALYESGFATLVLDLLTADEEIEDSLTGAIRLDIELFAHRIAAGVEWIREQDSTNGLEVGCFVAGVAAAGALSAASRDSDLFSAIVSKHGRPDLAGIRLHKVRTPTLLLVGESDVRCRELNRWALRRLDCEKSMEALEGASHHVEESEAIAEASDLAVSWFRRFMARRPAGFRSMFTLNWTERRFAPGPLRA
jgi:putative phosphoribosyl transferase